MHDGNGRVVLVDDRPERRRILREIFLAAGVPVSNIGEADDVVAAVELVDAQGADVVVLERQLPVPEGAAAIARLRSRFPLVRIAISSFGTDDETKQVEVAAGADFHLDKPLRTADARQVADVDGTAAPPGSGAAPAPALISSAVNPSR
jgi:CheY-like chemotaxis protein